MRCAGMQSILSELARIGRLQVVEEFKIDTPKTKQMVQKIKSLGFESVLVVTDDLDENLYLSSRNLPNVLVEKKLTDAEAALAAGNIKKAGSKVGRICTKIK